MGFCRIIPFPYWLLGRWNRPELEPLMQPVSKSAKLANVCYDIRGPVLDRAKQMEEEGLSYILGLLRIHTIASGKGIQWCPVEPANALQR